MKNYLQIGLLVAVLIGAGVSLRETTQPGFPGAQVVASR